MTWLQQHVYIATWASVFIAVIGVLIKLFWKTNHRPVNWSWGIIYVVFLATFITAFTSTTTIETRLALSTISGVLSGFIMADAIWTRN